MEEQMKENWTIIYDAERTLHECNGRVYESRNKRIEFDPVTLKEISKKEEPQTVTVVEDTVTVQPEEQETITTTERPAEEPKNPLQCEVCGKVCGSTAGKAAHMRAHTRI